jgi:hypothetical protein
MKQQASAAAKRTGVTEDSVTSSVSVDERFDCASYYRDAYVRGRLLEYCGATSASPPTAVFVAGLIPDDRPFPTWITHGVRVPTADLDVLSRRGCDIARSLWDREHLIFLIELDYENVDAPAEPYFCPAPTFLKLEPAYEAVQRLWNAFGLQTEAIATGRGYQFTGQIPLDHPVIDELASLAPDVPAWHDGVDTRRLPGVNASLDPRHARAAAGLGLILEFIAHLTMREASLTTKIPVVVNGTIVGHGDAERECVSIDFSHAGDPLDIRHVRMAFSTYQWHMLRPDIFGEVIQLMGPLIALPRADTPLASLLACDRGLMGGLRAARRGSVQLPDVSRGIAHIVKAYARSPLAVFHRAFHAALALTHEGVPDVDRLPPCIRLALEYPNDLLLKPEHVQHLVRGLMARHWRPDEIARLIQQKYEEDHGWGDRWSRQHAGTRAEFDVRVFAGLIHTGLDSLIDFNCVSAQEKDICPRTGCPYDLRRDRDRLQNIRRS